MTYINSVFFGFLQGLTEFFPVSSSAHLSILGNLFGMNSSDANYQMFCVFLHFGSMLAILIFYLQDFWEIISQFRYILNGRGARRNYISARTFLMMIVSSVPLIIIVPINSRLDSLFYSSVFIGVMLLISGTIMFIADHFTKTDKDERTMTMSDAFIIGICQIVGAIPGISRVGVTMSGAMATGVNKNFALKYSYLLSFISLFGVNVLHLVKSVQFGFSWSYFPMFLIGTAVSFGVSLLTIKLVSAIVSKKGFSGFAYYCWVAGVLFIILTMIF